MGARLTNARKKARRRAHKQARINDAAQVAQNTDGQHNGTGGARRGPTARQPGVRG